MILLQIVEAQRSSMSGKLNLCRDNMETFLWFAFNLDNNNKDLYILWILILTVLILVPLWVIPLQSRMS